MHRSTASHSFGDRRKSIPPETHIYPDREKSGSQTPFQRIQSVLGPTVNKGSNLPCMYTRVAKSLHGENLSRWPRLRFTTKVLNPFSGYFLLQRKNLSRRSGSSMTLVIKYYCLIQLVATNRIVQERNSGDISANNATLSHTSIPVGATGATMKSTKCSSRIVLA